MADPHTCVTDVDWRVEAFMQVRSGRVSRHRLILRGVMTLAGRFGAGTSVLQGRAARSYAILPCVHYIQAVRAARRRNLR